MLINNIIEIETKKPVIQHEQLSYKIEKRVNNNIFANTSEEFNLNIERLIKSDEFIIDFSYKNDTEFINNTYIVLTLNNKMILQNARLNKQDNCYSIECIVKQMKGFSDFSFKDLENINVEIIVESNNKLIQLYSLSYYLDKQFEDKIIRLNQEGAIISFIKDIRIAFKNLENIDTSLRQNSDINRLYFNFRPYKLSLAEWFKQLYEIDIFSKWDKLDTQIHNIRQTDYIDWQIKAIEFPNILENKINGFFNFTSQRKTIDLNCWSYYDKYNNQIVIDVLNEKSKLGIVIPPTFSGNFNHKVSLSFGNHKKEFILIYQQFFNKPYLDLYTGLVRLNILQKPTFFTKTNWSIIKYRNITKIIKEVNSLEELAKKGGE
ncbi:Uncharacterised protein [Metamycoplasma cloacale]|uniref:Uncharacterized protein n=1 Tax=Metamycoplasma cloacale TaxID=92401 RepID=A0A2Z4LMF2_9BACT|nr:hypothetical protein [Metamycoplasma cloacale]AWX42834.1 hypothetical protein DK849_02025 [Metamycoplasma cloacale]VEU79346.1 Uncharacterised protein [Metamycoplasma cloacale]